MAVLSQVDQAGALAGNVFSTLKTLFPDTVSIEEKGSVFSQSVLINVTTSENMTLELDITDKPIAPVTTGTTGGAGLDYAARRPVPLTITGVITNMSLSLIDDPVGTLTQAAGSLAPGVANALKGAGKLLDLGSDEIDKKLQSLYRWMNSVTPVIASGVRLDLNRIGTDREFTYIIKSIQLTSDLDNGDGVGVVLILESLLGQSAQKSIFSRGGSIADKAANGLSIATGKVNPFN